MPEPRVVILCGPRLPHRNTCATLIAAGVNVVGICIADQRTFGLPIKGTRRASGRVGLGKVASQVVARIWYRIADRGRDRNHLAAIFDEGWIEKTLAAWTGPVHRTTDYGRPETVDWLKRREPEVFVVHTPYWVGKKVRDIPRSGITLGGHPGLTPDYRGSHSALWAILKGKPEDVGCTVFLLDEGADTGDVVVQERIEVQPGDSFVTLGWRGMKRIAELQAETLTTWARTGSLPRRAVEAPEDSYFDNPTLSDLLDYKRAARRLQIR
jgi:hypothetical protein